MFLILTGCGQKPVVAEKNLDVPVSNEISQSLDLEEAFNLASEDTENESYFYPLDEVRDALASRIFLIDNAKKSIDVQYYIYKEDASGAFFTYHLLKAADKGMKVRILIDDLDTSGKDKSWLMGTLHPNISIKSHW